MINNDLEQAIQPTQHEIGRLNNESGPDSEQVVPLAEREIGVINNEKRD